MADGITYQRLVGEDIRSALEHLADLRIRVFREWPYLYDGDPAYERDYLSTYASSPRSVCVLARDGERVVGAATGIPLADETGEVVQPLREAGFPLQRIFYFGESVLLPEYRGRGIGVEFIRRREMYAREQGFSTVVFCAVQRPTDHPRRPDGYVPLDGFWRKRGFAPEPDLRAWFRWRDLDDHEETVKPLRFWSRHIA